MGTDSTGGQPSLGQRVNLVAGVGMLLANRALMRLGLRPPVDGWRHAAGLALRGEAATFVLSAFNLDVWSDSPGNADFSIQATQKYLAQRLAASLAGEAALRVRVTESDLHRKCEPCASASYTLGFAPWEDGPARFIAPENWAETSPGGDAIPHQQSLLNIICRINSDGGTDLWARANHVGIDGVPLQEVLSRLESAWGHRGPIRFPTSEEFTPLQQPRACAGRAGLSHVQDFLDFGPLLRWRSAVNATLPAPLTVSSALMWCMARHEAFAGIHMGSTVEVPAMEPLARSVSVVVVRPADYFGRQDGLARYSQDFNRQLDLTRKRQSEGCKTLDAAAFIPLRMELALLRHGLEEGGTAFGSLGLTILRDARVFVAPMGDFGHADGFIAIGSVALDAGDGRRVGCVTIKGPAHRISKYPEALKQVIGSCNA